MTLLSQNQKTKLINLFENNRFLEIELEIESISNFKDRSAFLANMLGVAKLKKPSATQKDCRKKNIPCNRHYKVRNKKRGAFI